MALTVSKSEKNDALEAERNKLLHRATIAEEWRDSDRQRAIDAEAKLAQAVEALTLIDALDPEAMSNGCSQSVLIGLVFRMGEIARATLAAIKGASAPTPHSLENTK